MAIGMRHQLISFFGGRIKADRVVDIVMFAKRHRRITTIDRRGTRIHQMRNFMMPAPLKDVHKSLQVRINISMWIFQRIAHTGLRRQMNNMIRLFSGEQSFHYSAVSNIPLDEGKFSFGQKTIQTRLLQGHIIIIIHIVDTDDRITTRQQSFCTMHPDKSRSACYQYFHRSRHPLASFSSDNRF